MSYTSDEVVARIERLSITRLETWVAEDCVRPETAEGDPTFTEADLARLRLLCTLRDDFEVNEEALPLVLSLIDQLHGVRRVLRHLTEAVEQQPRAVREEIARIFRETGGR
jgi:chaperone modulatory protein CbpM